MMNISVDIEDLTVIRGDQTVLHGLSTRIETGAITGLLGPSGCGKSTLIRCLAGIQKVASGSVHVLGDPAGSRANRARVGYVTQAQSVYPDLSVEQNLRYFAAISGADGAAIDQALEQVDLSGRRSQLTASLSGGQRTRVSLAAALLADPQILLLDEPTVGLDPVLRRDIWELFGQLAASGRTIFISSHVMDEADRCDHVLFMRDGRLIADRTPAQLREDTGTDDLEQAFLTIAEGAAA